MFSRCISSYVCRKGRECPCPPPPSKIGRTVSGEYRKRERDKHTNDREERTRFELAQEILLHFKCSALTTRPSLRRGGHIGRTHRRRHKHFWQKGKNEEPTTGIEPATNSFEGCYSIQLSYAGLTNGDSNNLSSIPTQRSSGSRGGSRRYLVCFTMFFIK